MKKDKKNPKSEEVDVTKEDTTKQVEKDTSGGFFITSIPVIINSSTYTSSTNSATESNRGQV